MEPSDSRARPVTMSPVGRVLSPFGGKFGAPRQPGIVPAAIGEIRFFPPWNSPDAFRGLEGFSHLWVLFLADQIPEETVFRPTVRPPRLGGNEKLGVFATRSLFRPNRMGLSLVRLLGIVQGEEGTFLKVGGLDLVDGTPVLDVKPYLPYAEALPDASGGFAAGPPGQVPVRLEAGAEAVLAEIIERDPGFAALLHQTLAADPRPAYQDDPEREYAFELSGYTVRFAAESGGHGLVVRFIARNPVQVPK